MSLFGNLFGDAAGASSSLFNPAFAKPATQPAPPALERPKQVKKAAKAERADTPDKTGEQEKREKKGKPAQEKGGDDTATKAKRAKQAEAEAEAAGKPKRRKRDEAVVRIETEDDPDKPRVKHKQRDLDEIRAARDDADKILRTVFVGNLASSATRKTLKRVFSQFGPVESTRLRSVPINTEDDKGTRRSKSILREYSDDAAVVNGYVVFETKDAAKAALALNMKVVEGRHLRVDRAARPTTHGEAEVEYDRTLSVFVGNMHFSTTEEDVIRHFHAGARDFRPLKNAVVAVRMVRDRLTNKGKGIGFVLFTTKEAARAALNMHGTKLKEREIRVMRIGQTGQVRLPSSKGKGKGKDAGKDGGGGGYKGSSSKGDKGGKIASGIKGMKAAAGGGKAAKGGAAGEAWRGMKSKKGDGEDMMKKLGVKKGGAAGGIKKKGSSDFGGKPKALGATAAADAKGQGKQKAKRPAVAARKAKLNARRDMMKH